MSYVGDAPGASYVPPVDPVPPEETNPPPPPPDDIDIQTAYYISASGSDSNDGTVTNPFATLAHFLALPPDPGTALIYRGGTPLSGTSNRNISLTNGLSGASGAPITLMAYPGEEPQVDLGANGTSDTNNFFLVASIVAASHWRISGLEFLNGSKIQSGLIATSFPSGLGDDWTIYGCTFHKVAPGDNTSNGGFYRGARTGDVRIERCTFYGPGWTGDQNDDANAIQCDHESQGGGLFTIRYNVFVDCVKGIQIYGEDGDARAMIEHNTFIDCGINIEVVHYDTATVRNNAGTTAILGSAENLYDSGEGTLTDDHNFWGMTFDGTFALDPSGQAAENAASDGTDAGAVDT